MKAANLSRSASVENRFGFSRMLIKPPRAQRCVGNLLKDLTIAAGAVSVGTLHRRAGIGHRRGIFTPVGCSTNHLAKLCTGHGYQSSRQIPSTPAWHEVFSEYSANLSDQPRHWLSRSPNRRHNRHHFRILRRH